MSIQKIISNVAQYGVARANRYRIEIDPPTQKIGVSAVSRLSDLFTPETKDRIDIECEEIVMPGRGITTTEVRSTGPMHRRPYGEIYSNEIPVTFRLTRDMFAKRLIDRWMDLIIDTDRQRLGWYSDYTTTVRMYQMDEMDRDVYGIEVYEVFPSQQQDLTYGHTQSDTIQRLMVSFSFKNWKRILSTQTTVR